MVAYIWQSAKDFRCNMKQKAINAMLNCMEKLTENQQKRLKPLVEIPISTVAVSQYVFSFRLVGPVGSIPTG